MLLLAALEVWGWYDWLVFSQFGLRPRFLSGDLAPGGWLQPGFRATCSYLGISAKLVNIQLLLLQPSSCQQEPKNSLHHLSAKGTHGIKLERYKGMHGGETSFPGLTQTPRSFLESNQHYQFLVYKLLLNCPVLELMVCLGGKR